MTRTAPHGLAAIAALHATAAAGGAAPQPEAAPRSSGRKRPLSMNPAAVRQRRAQAKKREAKKAAARAAGVIPSVISSVIDHAQDHAQDHAPRVVDLDLDLKALRARAPPKITRQITHDPDKLTRARLFKNFPAILKREAGLDYPELAPFLEQQAARRLLAENHVADVERAATQLVREWRRGDEWEREHRPPTLVYLSRHIVELLQRAPKPRPAAAAPQLQQQLALEPQEAPPLRILPGAAPREEVRSPAARERERAASRAGLATICEVLREKGVLEK